MIEFSADSFYTDIVLGNNECIASLLKINCIQGENDIRFLPTIYIVLHGVH
jgi:hypothetical protein